MKIRIVCYEDVNKWIIGKFAKKLHENLSGGDVKIDIGYSVDMSADINHHVMYGGFNGTLSTIDSLMITHVDNISKLHHLKKMLDVARIGICMSEESMNTLSDAGIDRSKLCYVNPAHDGIIQPRRRVVGITCRVQEDGRKREYLLGELAQRLDPRYFSFKIMGDGWSTYVTMLREKGFTVQYWDAFVYDEYTKLIESLDYYVYFGQDEGQIGFIDALAAGVETIATPQGYHLDVENGINYPFSTAEELYVVFDRISNDLKRRTDLVADWTWKNYATKHLEIWKYLKAQHTGEKYAVPAKTYKDGIFSILEFQQERKSTAGLKQRLVYKIRLLKNWFVHKYFLHNRKNSVHQ